MSIFETHVSIRRHCHTIAFVYLSYSSSFSAFLYVLLSHCGDFMSKKRQKFTQTIRTHFTKIKMCVISLINKNSVKMRFTAKWKKHKTFRPITASKSICLGRRKCVFLRGLTTGLYTRCWHRCGWHTSELDRSQFVLVLLCIYNKLICVTKHKCTKLQYVHVLTVTCSK